jgi:hypothetical protein
MCSLELTIVTIVLFSSVSVLYYFSTSYMITHIFLLFCLCLASKSVVVIVDKLFYHVGVLLLVSHAFSQYFCSHTFWYTNSSFFFSIHSLTSTLKSAFQYRSYLSIALAFSLNDYSKIFIFLEYFFYFSIHSDIIISSTILM